MSFKTVFYTLGTKDSKLVSKKQGWLSFKPLLEIC